MIPDKIKSIMYIYFFSSSSNLITFKINFNLNILFFIIYEIINNCKNKYLNYL